MAETKIQWTNRSWNPTTGCTRASAGCDNCYAFTMTKRLAAMGNEKYQGLTGNGHFNGVLKTWDDELQKPLHWKKPAMIFVNSMSDLFHMDVPFEFIDKVFAVMALCPQHTFQVLTKRPERMAEYLASRSKSSKYWEQACPVGYALRWEHNGTSHPLCRFPLQNVWLGTSVENQVTADERIPHLLKCPAAVRFLSCEPLLGPIDLTKVGNHDGTCANLFDGNALYVGDIGGSDFAWTPRGFLNWAIIGGESGPGARPCRPEWIRSLVAQCKSAGVACFVKQMGANVVTRNDMIEDQFNNGESGWPDPEVEHDIHGYREEYQGADCRIRLRDKKGGNILEWPLDLRVREFPKVKDANAPE